MGQKVHPIGFRLIVPLSQKQSTEENFNNWNNIYCTGQDKGNYNNYFYQNKIIKKFISNYLAKWGFWVNKIVITRTTLQINIKIQAYSTKEGVPGKPSWSSQGIQCIKTFFDVHPEKFENFQKFLSKNLCENIPVKIFLETLNKKNSEKTNKNLRNALKGAQYRTYAQDSMAVMSLATTIPAASLVAIALTEALEKNHRHQTVIDFFGETFKWLFNNLPPKNLKSNLRLSGCLIQVKGRINGSDRSRRSIIRLGSLPLHTITAKLDYAFEEVVTPYGVCGIKVWLCYQSY